MSDVAEEGSASSVELGRRAGNRAETRMLIDGELVEAASGTEFTNVSPATGFVLGSTAAAGFAEMERAVGAARRAFDETDWSTNRALRARCLEQLQQAIESESDELRVELIAEVGCPEMTTHNAQLEWPLAESLRYPGKLIDEFEWERTLDGGGLFGDRNVRTVVQDPVGVVAAICPSNFPIEVILNKLGPALAAGNTLVLKPDPNTPWNATRLGRLIAEHTDIPAGVVNVVPTPANEVANVLSTDPRVDMISFTGSTAVGKQLMRNAADTMKRTFLELGGKSALVVLDDADPSKLVQSALGAVVHAGQACAMTSRVLVHQALFDEALRTVSSTFSGISVGDPASPKTIVGPVITATQRDRVLEACTQARRDGAEITVGGGVVDGLPDELSGGNYVQPTVIVSADNRSVVAQEEIFGPVVVMMPFADDDEAVRIANDSSYGLAGAVMSGSNERGMAVARRIRTGAMGVNGGMFYGADAPFGGFKHSGVGRQCGLEGFQQYLETKTIGYRAPRRK